MGMLKLGDFIFSVDTAAYQALQRSTARRWAKIQRIGKRVAHQDLGPGDDAITLPGVIYPTYKGGLTQIDEMRKMMNAGEPLMMVDGQGNVHDKWIILSVTGNDSVFFQDGVAQQQDFSIKIERFEE
ncbi:MULTISPECIES: phage tail protein [Maridesulfovibrio]|uniref:p2 GpU family protein n=1 Tax=Maridesulfovibrio salexigens (strain ATCC 14822 / DSM 2638 / NCIMB 8403 / VKM B-1763) TaxID=526222 RepID=C6BVX0_MARSD|nr:phage tail protein [Maridesulfovibrio salexigens]ACS80173.1 P2 GpU family protein [Maridesulfovibrio salexigens DSM 2638]